MRPPQELPRLRHRRLAYYKIRPSHSEQIEQLNALDAIIFKGGIETDAAAAADQSGVRGVLCHTIITVLLILAIAVTGREYCMP